MSSNPVAQAINETETEPRTQGEQAIVLYRKNVEGSPYSFVSRETRESVSVQCLSSRYQGYTRAVSSGRKGRKLKRVFLAGRN